MKKSHYEQYQQLCVLSVDDDAVNLMVVEQLLAPQGWKIISSQDGEDAMAVLLEEDTWPDFVFLDYQMNVGDSGDEICRKMRQVFGAAPIPIVMCTAMTAGSSALEACKRAGATDYLLKPYERMKMISKIEQYCPEKVRGSRPYEDAPAPLAPPAHIPTPTFVPAPMAVSPPAPSPIMAPPAPPQAPSSAHSHSHSQLNHNNLVMFFINLDLEYCGQKLAEKGVTIDQLRQMDDRALRMAGIVVKSQRDKILSAIRV